MDRRKQLQKKEAEEVKDKAERPAFTQQDEAKPDFHDPADFLTIDQRETMRELDDSQLAGPPPPPPPPPPPLSSSTSTDLVVARDVHVADAQVPAAATIRKRGRPPRARGNTVSSPPPQRKQAVAVDEEEDVCFICFDGGSLVLCDRRGCPKAYHPTCIKRDEAFFRSKAKWDCGWHICSSCQKSSYYMCYTCTYSLCKRCTKGADYVYVRDNKGFCGICMKTIMLIENITVGNVDQQVQVDFDDKTSWEYLFKVYWVYLKEKESLTIDDLTNAKNPWKGDELPKARNSSKRNGFAARKEILSCENFNANNGEVSCLNNCDGNGEIIPSKRRKTNDKSEQIEQKSIVLEKATVQKAIPMPEGTTWATKALLEFIGHMKNGDQSMLSESDVQDLLLEYIERNNLRDPSRKAEVVCDARLTNLFRRPRVGHSEMLKLLEYHFLTKEKSPPHNNVSSTTTYALSRQLGAGCSDSQLAMGSGRQHITDKKIDEKGSPINPIANEYAAIDAHNINLLYLKCNLMEKLLDDADSFHEKVVGSFVRIRVAVGDITQEVYRLVQVVGTLKVYEPYTIGSRTSNLKLEILNLERKEVISIDGISDQDFSEEECRRLRQTIKCGLIKPLKVGEIQEKAAVLQAVKVSASLEAEILQLNNLRDRASEKGHRKELRECVEKLELLKSPKELERRLLDIPSVHVDPKMDPKYVSEEDAEDKYDINQGHHMGLNNSGFPRKGIELNSSPGECDLNDLGHRALKTLAAASEQVEMNSRVDLKGTENSSKNQLGDASSAPVTSNSVPGVASSVIPPLSNSETENVWNYQDPSGKIQGPFPMVQLRKWSEINIFPDDFRVWRISEKQQDSILLTEALTGRFPEDRQLPRVPPKEAAVPYKDTDEKQEHVTNVTSEDKQEHVTNVTSEDNKRTDIDQKPMPNDLEIHGSSKSNEVTVVKEREGGSNPSNADVESLRVISKTDAIDNVEKRANRDGLLNSSTNGWDPNSSFLSMLKSIEKPEQEQNQKFDFPNMPITAPMQPNEGLKHQVAENNPGPPPSWSTPSSLVIRQVPEVAADWLSFSPAPAKRSVEQWDINLVSPSEGAHDCAVATTSGMDQLTLSSTSHPTIVVTATSGMDQLTLSSTSHPTIVAPSWHSMVPEPAEFCSLVVDESVSDLLAEVEAMEMESLNGLPSPTSKLRYDLELAPGSDDDCFSPIERFNPNPNPNPGIQVPTQLSVVEESLCLSLMPSQPTTIAEPLAPIQQQVIIQNEAPQKSLNGGSRPSEISVNQWDMHLDIRPPEPNGKQRQLSGSDGQAPVGPTATQWEDGPSKNPRSTVDAGRRTNRAPQGNANAGVAQQQGSWGGQSRHGSESRHSGQRDHRHHSHSSRDPGSGRDRDSGSGRDRSSWGRQPGYGGAGSYRGPSKGQRVCKFYESGHCKKGASCSYWHP